MSFPLTKGAEVTKADLDILATLANLKLVNSMQDMVRTADMLRRDQPGYTPGTMSGAFSFSTPTETWTSPLGSPSVQSFERWAWLDEINRIWACLWNIEINNSPNPSQPTANGNWDTFADSPTTTYDQALATQRVDDYWDPLASYPARGADTENNGEKIVASPGPDCWMESGTASTALRYYRYARALYSREQDAFEVRSGLWSQQDIVGTTNTNHPQASPAIVTFTFGDIFNHDLYGYLEFEFTQVSAGDDDPLASSHGIEFVSTIGGANFGSGYAEQVGTKVYLWLGDNVTRGDPAVILSGLSTDVSGDGNQSFHAWVDAVGWNLTKTTWRGGFSISTASSTGVTATSDKVIHPRNVSVKIALHDLLYNSPLLAESDILNFDSIAAPYGMELMLGRPGLGVRGVDNYLRRFLQDGTQQLLDDDIANPPAGDDPAALTAMVADLNDRVIEYPRPIWQLPEWGDVTLRPSTQWLLDLDPLDPDMLSRLNRLLLEDAYTTQIRRIPITAVAPSEEVYELTLPDPTGIAAYNSFQMLAAHKLSDPDIKLIYLADSIPQWCYNTCLDFDLPNCYSGSTSGSGHGGPRGHITSTENYTAGDPALNPTPSNWPVFNVTDFGRLQSYSSRDYRTHPHMNGYSPYWRWDTKHGWYIGPPTIVPTTELYRATAVFAFTGNTAAGRRIEWSCKNRNVTCYVSNPYGDFPDPADPGTYAFETTRGYVIWPDDFTTPDDYDGGFLVTIKNTSADSQTVQEIMSTFSPEVAESPPETAPNFFPAYEPNNGVQLPGVRPFGESRIFADVQPGNVNPVYLNLPVPKRGYMVRHLHIRRLRVLNAEGIYVAPAATGHPAVNYSIGIMAGAGVIAGAIMGCYPGEYVEFTTGTLAANEAEEIVKVMYPVLDGCPLAYEAHTVGGDVDTLLEVFASVEFQPGINNNFVRTDDGTGVVDGGFYGQPFLSDTWGWHLNYNSPTEATNFHWSRQPAKHRWDSNDVMPPISAEALNEIYKFMDGMTVLP